MYTFEKYLLLFNIESLLQKNPSVISNNKESDYSTASEPKEEDGTINVEEVGENIGYSSSNRF